MAVTSYLTREFMKLSSIYPSFEEDLLREVSLQKVALRTIRLRVNHQLTPGRICSEVRCKESLFSEIRSRTS